MKTIYLIMTNLNIEFKNSRNEFTGWDEHPLPVYAFTTLADARKEIEKLRENEVIEYKKWLRKDLKKCFTHHQFSINEIMVFNEVLPY